MNERVVRASNFDQQHDLCPCKNVARLVRHFCVKNKLDGTSKASRESRFRGARLCG